MSDVVIVAYRPKKGMGDELEKLVRAHVPELRRLDLVTDRPSVTLRGQDGVILEVFEWAAGAIAKAHEHPDVQRMWDRFAAVCDYVPLKDLPEAARMFAEFKPLDAAD